MAEATYPSGQQEGLPRNNSFNKRLDELKKFASSSFIRAKQYTAEKLGKADSVTEFDSEFESLSLQLENIKMATQKILIQVQALVQPNPGHRIEDRVYSRLDRPKPHHTNPHELLSVELSRAGNAFGPETQYGAYLLRCAEVEQKLGQCQKRFEEKAMAEFITPLKAFLEIDVKAVMHERKMLNVKRLDLDASRSKAKKAQQGGGEKLQTAETEVRAAQAEYDMQLDKVRSSLKRIVHTHVNHLGHLKTFMAAQRSFSAECQALLGDIEEDSPSGGHGNSGGGATEDTDRGTFEVNGVELDREESRKARVLYDYDAENENELTIYADQIIIVTPIPGDDEYMMAELEGQFGRIPTTYVEML